MGYPAYTEYGNAEADWLGTLPSEWTFRRLRFIATEPLMYGANEAAVLDDRELPRYIRITDVEEDGTLDDNTFRSLEEDVAAPYMLKEGDILLARSGATVGKSFQYLASWGRAAYAGYLIRFRPDQNIIFPRFANYYFQTECYWACIRSTLIQATIENFSAEKYKDLKLPLPPKAEQKQIAVFLDWKTGQIDALMAGKKELLEKLKEKRIAVITQAVTQGLNPAARMRDSGIPWLGQVPQHWDVMKMSWVCKSIRDGTHNPPDRAPGIHRLLSVRNVQDGKFSLLSDDRTMTPEDFAELQQSYTVEENDIVLAIVGATTGKSAIVGRLENVTVQRSLAILRPDGGAISGSFLHYVIQSPIVQTEIALTVFKYSAQPGIYLDDVGRLPVVRPPAQEQAAIAAYLDAETEKLDALVGKVEAVIDRLTEYRTALITAATTGKIDVRNVKVSTQG